ncbi:MAG: hypothetical protein Q7U57_08405 [Methylovulum sp.]|nr:hypothetical protein [Methylovulum sp.]
MKKNFFPLICIPLLFTPCVYAVDLGHGFSLKGFGTAGMVANTDDQADYVANHAFQNYGAGRSDQVTYQVDTRFGMQMDWQALDRLSFTAQAITKQYEDKTWEPRLEWGYAKVKLLDNVDVRAGQIRPAIYMLSDYLDINYANPWVRPPSDFYSAASITHMTGIDFLWRPKTGPVTWLVQPYFGESNVKLVGGSNLDAENIAGINLTANYQDFTFRFGFVNYVLTLHSNDFDTTLIPALQGLCLTIDPVACQAISDFGLKNAESSFGSIGVTWDNGDYFITSEAGRRNSTSRTVSALTSWYISGGARFNEFTPYVTFSSSKSEDNTVYTSGSVYTNQIITALLANGGQNQSTFTLGVRYDFYENFALKFQWDRIDTQTRGGQAGTGKGLFINPTTEFGNSPNTVDLLSTSIDFVF